MAFYFMSIDSFHGQRLRSFPHKNVLFSHSSTFKEEVYMTRKILYSWNKNF